MTLIAGGGAAGLGPLIAAARLGKLDDWLDQGWPWLTRAMLGGGKIGRYNINADTLSSTFLECLEGPALSELFQAVREDKTTKQLEEWRHGMPPLALIGDYMARLGQTLRDYVTRHQSGSCRLNTLLHSVHLKTDGTIEARLVEMNGEKESIRAETLILALGGYQDFGQTCLLELYPGSGFQCPRSPCAVDGRSGARWGR